MAFESTFFSLFNSAKFEIVRYLEVKKTAVKALLDWGHHLYNVSSIQRPFFTLEYRLNICKKDSFCCI